MSTHWLSEDERAAWLRFAALIELLPGVLNAQLTRDENLTHFDYFTLPCCQRRRSGPFA